VPRKQKKGRKVNNLVDPPGKGENIFEFAIPSQRRKNYHKFVNGTYCMYIAFKLKSDLPCSRANHVPKVRTGYMVLGSVIWRWNRWKLLGQAQGIVLAVPVNWARTNGGCLRPSSARMYASLFFLRDMKFFSAMGRRLDNVIGGHRLQASGKWLSEASTPASPEIRSRRPRTGDQAKAGTWLPTYGVIGAFKRQLRDVQSRLSYWICTLQLE
jgi:hypothetical protein